MNDYDLKIIQAMNSENLLRHTVNGLRQELGSIGTKDAAPEPAKSYWQGRIEKTEAALATAIKALNTAEIGKMLSLDVRVISTSPKRRTMQIVMKDKDNRHSETRHLKWENGGWHGYSLLRRGIVNYSVAGLLSEAEVRHEARAA